MTKRMEIGGYLIVQLEDQLSADKALGELVDNAFDANASIISIILTTRSMTIWDNGDGTDDPNVIATPSMSHSRFKKTAIGSKAIGAKQAMATFGRKWDIGTVPKGKNIYHHYVLEWDENGKLPLQYEGYGVPKHSAPAEIRNGGTKITVTGRRDGFPSLRLDKLCRSLEDRYRPYLNSGVKIVVRNPEVRHNYELRNPADDPNLFSSPINELEGKISKRSFAVRYGALKEDHRILSGCHFIYGPRVIVSESRINKSVLPSACYVDVKLGDEWKTCLATNKDDIIRYKDDLLEVLEQMLGDWIAEQREAASVYKLQVLSGIVSDMLNESLAFLDKSTEGDYQSKRKIKRPGIEETSIKPDDEITIVRSRKKRRTKAMEGGKFSSEKETLRRCAKLKIVPDKLLGPHLFKATFSPNSNEVTIRLNIGDKQREIAEYYKQNRRDELYKIGVLAFGILVATNPAQYVSLFAGLRANGYNVDASDHQSDIISMVSNFMLDALFGQRGSIKQKVA